MDGTPRTAAAAPETGSGGGQLLLAATPLGNIGDASARLRHALISADTIAAEDTRSLRQLSAALEVQPTASVQSFYDAVEARRMPALLQRIAEGQTVLLLSDAGMPSISDPGFRLVEAAVARGLAVSCLPGPSAVTTALALSGLPCARFCFEGFAPRKQAERRRWLEALGTEHRTVVFFESPHRIGSTMRQATDMLGAQRRGAVCRELTKRHEQVLRGTLGELADAAADGLRGEITVVVEGAAVVASDPEQLVDQLLRRVDEGIRLKDAAAELAGQHGVSKKGLYDAALRRRER